MLGKVVGGARASRKPVGFRPLPANCSEDERALASALEAGEGGLHVDELSRSLHLDAGRVSSALALMEVRGLVHRLPGMIYERR